MRRIIRGFLSSLVFIIILLAVLYKTTNIMQRKSGDFKYIPFFEHAADCDVWFMGTSHVINAVFPMELWNKYGITSYNFGGHGNQPATTYWVFMNALDYANPKLVVIDCYNLGSQQKTDDNFSYAHLSFDAFPLTMTKIRAVNDLMNDPEIARKVSEGIIDENEKHSRLGLLWDFSVYHSRWEYISQEDFVETYSKEYGAESRIQIAEPGVDAKNPGSTQLDETVGMKYLKMLIEECRDRDIDVVLTYLPHPAVDEDEWKDVNTVYDIAKEYGVPYINFFDEDVIDYSVDCYDPDSHLNPAGAWKITGFIGDYLRNECGMEDQRGDERYSYWNEDYDEYEMEKNSRLSETGDLNTYLMLLEDDNYGYEIYVGNPRIFEDTVTMRLFKNKGIPTDRINDDTKYILVRKDDVQIGNDTIVESFDELFGTDMDMLEKNKESIIVRAYNHRKKEMIDTSIFAIPEELDMNDRSIVSGFIVVLDSKAVRVSK